MFGIFCCRIFKFVSFLLVLLLFVSCIGAASQVTLASDGSGSILLEYRISSELESLGRLDGNQYQPPLPAARTDLERSVARISGLDLVSYSSRQDGKDIVYRAELSFSSPQALTAFFDSSGRLFRIDFSGRKLIISLMETGSVDTAFKEFADGFLHGYEFSVSFTVPGTAGTQWVGADGSISSRFPGVCFVSGPTVQYTVPMTELVFLESPLFLEISW